VEDPAADVCERANEGSEHLVTEYSLSSLVP